MKKIQPVLWTLVLSSIFFSCSHGFLKDPRLYNSKDNTKQAAFVPAPEPDLGLTGGVDAFDKLEEWYNNPNSNGDANDPTKEGFPHTEFDNMSLVGTWFNDSNVPVYAMASGNVWVAKDSSKNEYIHSGAPNTSGQGYEIKNVNWYQYRGLNPLYDPNGNYNTRLQSTANGNPKLSRFYFYRFTGDTLSPSLDNFLFAVDSYSKLMFAFAYPTESQTVFGNDVPRAWGPTDGKPHLGKTYQFYMYDPVGYVSKDGGKYTVTMYDWFKNNLAKGEYQPTLGAFSTEAQKTSSGAGTSPFNNQTVDFFADNMKLLANKVFYRREKMTDGGYGLVLYKYSINSEGTLLTRTAESWNGLPPSTSLDEVTYTIGEGKSATEGVLKDLQDNPYDFTLTDESRTLTISRDSTTEVAVQNFDDPGPSFRERVKNAKYLKGITKYEFSDDGNTLTWTYDFLGKKTKSYNWDGDVTDTGYTTYGGYRIQLYNDDSRIKGATVPHVGGASIMEYEAYRFYEKGDTFTDSVKNKVFYYRDSNAYGYDLTLHSLEFSQDGTKVSVYTETWNGQKKAQGTMDVADGTENTQGTLNGTSVTLSFPDGGWQLKYGEKTYTLNYDPGPSFVNRLQYGGTFVSEDKKTVYRVSNFGRTIRMTYSGGWLGIGSFDYTYQYIQAESTPDSTTSRAVYKADNGIAGFSFAGFELSEKDHLIKSSRTSGASATGFVWDMTYDARSDGDIGGIPTEEDMAAFYESMKGKTFKARNTENGVAGLNLYTWTFDSTGRAGTLKKQTWLSNGETEVVTIPANQLVAQSRTTGVFTADENTQYTFRYDEGAGNLRVEGGEISGLIFSSNYNDPGPGFINRVKGKTYVGPDGYSYQFSADGRSVLFKNPNAGWLQTKEKTYTFEQERDKEYDNNDTMFAAYKENNARFWAVKISNNDTTIHWTGASLAAPGHILDSGVCSEWEAYLQK